MPKSPVISRSVIAALVAAFAVLTPARSFAADPLPQLHADAARTSVSGLSSGAFMAVQYDVAFSASVLGAGVVAGGPYNCSYVNFGGIATCMQGAPSGTASVQAAQGFAVLGRIDPVANVARHRIYLFSGTRDSVIHQTVVNAVRDFYTALGVQGERLAYVDTMDAGHAFIAPGFDHACPTNASPYINTCATAAQTDYDQPGAILAHLYGALKPKAAALSAQVAPFDQSSFGRTSVTGLAETGYVYIPQNCAASQGAGCAVHVVFHGCQQGAGVVGGDVYAKLGYNQWADGNGIIVLYPQVNPTNVPANPQGCWDWWGYTGLSFQTKSGPQMDAIHQMIGRLTGK